MCFLSLLSGVLAVLPVMVPAGSISHAKDYAHLFGNESWKETSRDPFGVAKLATPSETRIP